MPRLSLDPLVQSPPKLDEGAQVVPMPVGQHDVALVAALLAGHRNAGLLLFDRYGRHVERVVARVLGPDSDIPDLVQDVFASAISSLDKLEDASSLKSWLTRIAVFKTRTHIRNRQRWRFIEHLPFGKTPDVEARIASPEINEALRTTYEVLAKLAAEDRILFALRFIDGMELAEIAEAYEVSLSTAKRRIKKVRAEFVELARKNPVLCAWLDEEVE